MLNRRLAVFHSWADRLVKLQEGRSKGLSVLPVLPVAEAFGDNGYRALENDAELACQAAQLNVTDRVAIQMAASVFGDPEADATRDKR